MQAEDIEMYLAELGNELQSMGEQQPMRILLVGGAFMLTQFHNRPATNDIDILFKDVDNTAASSLYQTFKAAARSIARRNQLPLSWVNDVIGDFLRDISIVPQGTLWRTYGPLEVYIPPDEYILALKLLASRPKDQEDIQALCQQLHVQTRNHAQQIVDRYIPNKQVQQLDDLDKKLNSFFP